MTTDQLEARKALNKNILKFGCFPIVVLSILFGLTNALTNNTTPTSKETASPDNQTYFKILESADLFSANFNKFMKEVDSPLRIHDIQIEEGGVNNTFQYIFNDQLGLIGTLNKRDNTIRGIAMIAQGDGTIKSGANIFIVITGIIVSTNPGLIPEERGGILKDLGLFKKNTDINNLSGNTIRNNIKYYISSSNQVGIVFGAQHANE